MALDLDYVADLSGGAVGLDHFDGVGRIASHSHGFLDGDRLPVGIRRCYVFALAVARLAPAGDQGVDLVASRDGIFQPLEDDGASPLGHDEAVSPAVERI